MAMEYTLICLLDLPFNFNDIEAILSKKKSDFSILSDYVTGQEFSDLKNIITHFKNMQLETNPIFIDIKDIKYKEFYTVYFTNTKKRLNVACAFYEEKIKKEVFHYNIQHPNINLYLHILLDLVQNYVISEIQIYQMWE